MKYRWKISYYNEHDAHLGSLLFMNLLHLINIEKNFMYMQQYANMVEKREKNESQLKKSCNERNDLQ
jgi:hypothetical protein